MVWNGIHSFCLPGKEAFTFPMVAFWGSLDRRISESMIRRWQSFTSEELVVHKVDGHHLWPLTPVAKAQWLQMIVDELEH